MRKHPKVGVGAVVVSSMGTVARWNAMKPIIQWKPEITQ